MNEEKEMELIVNLKKFNSDLMDLNIKCTEEIERLHSIIKEAREYVKTMYTYGIKNNSLQRNELLEILDKEKL